jgi:uncharacterized membrane protein
MIVLVHLNLVILPLVATNPLFHAMTMMHVPMMNAAHTLDALTPQLIAMITTHVLMTPAIHKLDATMNATNVNTKMLAIL